MIGYKLTFTDNFWLDTCAFEKTFKWANGKQARELTVDDFQTVCEVVDLYTGGSIGEWYQDWCIFERERFQTMYLVLLDKLVQL